VAHAVSLGVARFIVLDLARVGTGTGPGTESLCGELVNSFPHVEIYAGGGVRNVADLRRMREAGIHGALVASALHDGALNRDDLAGL
jgi:phosphoribosylformimino-5-aminoimidazole carboxamide ribotide isomerase